jgi:predicted ribosome quality control (RQC) complex YloA/Tae2 family protein
MEKKEITSLDLRFLVKELRKTLAGGLVRKIYQYGTSSKSKQLLLEVFVPTKGAFWLYIDESKIFLTKFKKAIPTEPPNFCMFLRKHIMGRKIKDIRQHGFDRIVEIEIGDNVLIVELFHPGNFILTDSTQAIIMPLEVQKWKDREIRPRRPYKYPPKPSDPFKMDLDDLRTSILRSDKKIVAHLATRFGLGSEYAKEFCHRADIDPNLTSKEMKISQLVSLHNVIDTISKRALEPSIYDDFVSAFPLKSISTPPKQTKTFSEALDEFFSSQQIEIVKEEKEREVVEEKEKVERIVTQQTQAGEKWERIEKESKDRADRIYNHYSTVEGALAGVRKARDSGLSWDEIREKTSTEATPEAESIKEIREGDGVIVLNLGGMDVEIDITKTVEENAAKYYEDAKWAKRKMGGLGEAMEDHKEKLEEAQAKEERTEQTDFREEVFPKEKREYEEERDERDEEGEIVTATGPEEKERKPRKKWYEKFRWFFTSDGLLVVAGKDATSNENLIKKHADNNDLIFHADIHGAAFAVIKTQGMEVPDESRKEAAEFAAAHCKAWNKGIGNVDVFSVKPEQVSKSPPSGQSLPKGSFMIYGEREWYRDLELKLAIGVKIEREEGSRVLSGPVMAMRKHTDYFVTIKPGFKKSLELARTVKNKILMKSSPENKFIIEQTPLDEFQALIPSGTGEIAEYA